MGADLRRIITIDIGAVAGSRQLYGRACRVHGFAVAESTGAATAAFVLRNGTSDAGEATVPVNLVASESAREYWGESGISFTEGLHYTLVSGSVVGTVWVSELAGDVSAIMQFE